MRHILFLAHRIPYPPNKGDKVRSYDLLKYLAARFRVHLGAFIDNEADLQHADALNDLCEEIHLVRLRPGFAKVKSLVGLITGKPLTLPYYRSTSMQAWVDRVLRTAPVTSALVFSSSMAQYLMPARNLRRVADLVDVDSDKWQQYAAGLSWPYSAIYQRESRTLLEYERAIAREFDATVFVSAAEAALFKRLAPNAAHKVWHANNGVDSDYFSPDLKHVNPYRQDERVLVFTGAMDYWPNVDAVINFARNIFPQILGRIPGVQFYIVGARPSPEVAKLAALPGVTVTGTVPDIRPYIAHARLAVAPLRVARGVQNKVLEAMAMGKTVIASRQAAEGIEARYGYDLLVAADDHDFALQTVNELQSDGSDIGARARERIRSSYAWQTCLSRLDHLLAGGLSGNPVDATGNALQLANDRSSAT